MTYRSKLEQRLAEGPLKGLEYEATTVTYPKGRGRYTIDFANAANDLWIEVKGHFKPSDRTKMLRVQAEHPDRDIRFVFQTPHQTLSKKSDTTYAQWAEKHGFPWCDARDTETLKGWAEG